MTDENATTYLFFDTETYWMPTRGKATLSTVPRMVCFQYAFNDDEPRVLGRRDGAIQFLNAIRDEHVVFVGANTGFDMLVCARAVSEELGRDITSDLFNAYDNGRVMDVLLRAKLYDIERGGTAFDNSLASVAKRAGVVDKVAGKRGIDVWRARYDELDGIDPANWPRRAYEYAYNDVIITRDTFHAYPAHSNEAFQAMSDFWLKLATAWGLRIDMEWAERLDAFYAASQDKWARVLEACGLIVDGVLKRSGKVALVEEAWAELGEEPTRTDKGSICTDSKVIDYLEDQGVRGRILNRADYPWIEDIDLIDSDGELAVFDVLSRYNKATKFRSTYLEPILDSNGGPLCAGYDALKDTGRTGSRSPNVQNMPSRVTPAEKARRKALGDQAVVGVDIRGAFIPRPGCAFATADYTALEMAGLAQVLVNLCGELTPLAIAINAGDDLHLRVVESALGIPYEEAFRRYHEDKDPVIKSWRDLAKVANYSFPTGAAAKTFIAFARQQGITVPASQAEHIRNAWYATWEEMDYYRKYVARCETYSGMFFVEQHGPMRTTSGWRLRGTDRFTSAANTLFQGICADGAKYAGWLIAKACYTQRDSPLYGARTVLFVHDEFVLECAAERAQECAEELSRLMVEGMRVFTPDILIQANPEVLYDRWKK